MNLPQTMFFTFEQLLRELAALHKIDDFNNGCRCTYLGYVDARKCYTKLRVEAHLVENEIGGVIGGSLVAAQQRSPLSREQYMEDLRSNLGKETEHEKMLRGLVYDEYENYVEWKSNEGKFDLGDVVMRLLREDWHQYFASGKTPALSLSAPAARNSLWYSSYSAYLDEIQDLSYAAIYLICGLAGKDKLKWVCAGDPAQMISPGCSFTFDGLKQTLLAVCPGIENHLKQVTHLLTNYRTTKDVLHLANEVLAVARREYPGAVPFARRETAKKDLGLKVVLCDRNTAFQQKLKLGSSQAVVYSSADSSTAEDKISDWIGSHPFVVSSLDSKGLEFDDVIVFFDHDRTVWNLTGKAVSSLRMLRELYVAITRAQRRVVILTNRCNSDMITFFERLNCEFQVEGAELVLRDFDVVTTPEEWFKKAQENFINEMFAMAARCFDIAGKSSWFHWSQGKNAEAHGNDDKAAEEFLLALNEFGSERDYEQVLNVSLALASPSIARKAKWDKFNDKFLDEAMKHNPRLLQRFDACSKVRLALLRDAWETISVDDLKDGTLTSLFVVHRGKQNLKSLIKKGNDDDRLAIAEVLPSVVGDFHKDRHEFARATELFLRCGHRGISDAIEATKASMSDTDEGRRFLELPRVVQSWSKSGISPRNEQRVELLLELFRSVAKVTPDGAKKFLLLHKNTIITAVDYVLGDRIHLGIFSCGRFFPEISAALIDRHDKNRIEVAKWFLSKNENELGWQFLLDNCTQLTNEEICVIVRMSLPCRTWVLQETKRRGIFPLVCLRTLGSELSDSDKKKFLDLLSEFAKTFECTLASLLAWCFESNIGETMANKPPVSRTATKRAAKQVEETAPPSPSKMVDPAAIISRKLLSAWPGTRSDISETNVFSEFELKAVLKFAYNNFAPCRDDSIHTFRTVPASMGLTEQISRAPFVHDKATSGNFCSTALRIFEGSDESKEMVSTSCFGVTALDLSAFLVILKAAFFLSTRRASLIVGRRTAHGI